MLALITIFLFLSVALLAGVVLYPLLSKAEPLKSRVAKLMPKEEERLALVHTPKKWQLFLAEMGSKLRVTPADLRSYRDLTTAAGFRKEMVYIFLGSKLFLAAALPATYLILVALPQGKLGSGNTILITIACAISGYLAPSYWISRRAKHRKEEIFHSLPDVLDLLTICVEAGLSLDAALMRTAENFQHKDNPLIKEINMVILEISAGVPRSEALKGLAERTMIEDIKSFVVMLVQTEKFGTSLGKTLRTFSDSLRVKRRQLAEENAAKTSVKMLFPLTFFVFPALLVVMLVPAFFKIYAMFEK